MMYVNQSSWVRLAWVGLSVAVIDAQHGLVGLWMKRKEGRWRGC